MIDRQLFRRSTEVMFDVSKGTVVVPCEDCRRHHSVQLGQVAAGKTVRCGCGTTIQLVDHNKSVAQSIRKVNAEAKKLEGVLKKLGGR